MRFYMFDLRVTHCGTLSPSTCSDSGNVDVYGDGGNRNPDGGNEDADVDKTENRFSHSWGDIIKY